MDKRHIALVCALVVVMACFFQFNRMDGFLHLFGVRNETGQSPVQQLTGAENISRDKYLLLYDEHDVPSVFARHRLKWLLEQEKKDCDISSVRNGNLELSASYRGIIIATGYLDKVAAWPKIEQYVAAGGTALCLMSPESAYSESLSPEYLSPLGIKSTGGNIDVKGISLKTDFLYGGKGFSFGDTAYSTNTIQVALEDGVKVHMASCEGEPLVWEKSVGKGKYLVYNGLVRDDKTNIGMLTAILGGTPVGSTIVAADMVVFLLCAAIGVLLPRLRLRKSSSKPTPCFSKRSMKKLAYCTATYAEGQRMSAAQPLRCQEVGEPPTALLTIGAR